MTKSLKSPGFWRRIKLYPVTGAISAGLEDDFHRFQLQLTHADGVITGVKARADRIPWSTCPGAAPFLAQRAVGRSLDNVASLGARAHCTHLFDLLGLCAAHALDRQSTQFDLHVADRQENCTAAILAENDVEVLRWNLNGSLIEGPEPWVGKDLRELSRWRQTLAQPLAERAMLLRRAVHVSGGRRPEHQIAVRAADRGVERMGACFTYQMPRALDALRSPDPARDFSRSDFEPLQDFDPLD